jgi:hypothetical protein
MSLQEHDGATGMTGDALAKLRAAILADPALQEQLGWHEERSGFVQAALAEAAARGIAIAPGALAAAVMPDPVGASRFSGSGPTGSHPGPGWLPINLIGWNGQVCVDWAWFGDAELREPFFESSIRIALRRPLNRLARHCTPLSELGGATEGAVPVAGFIFHMSRCGSTLAAQMLAADPSNIVISEASPIDQTLRLDVSSIELHARLLRQMVAALCRPLRPKQNRAFVKLDSWHTLALPLFRHAFPDVPWAFFYREPSEVLVSQIAERGIQTVPEYLPPQLFGLSAEDAIDSEAYCARVLSRTCEAVLLSPADGGLLVNYREMPEALLARIAPHFGYAPDSETRTRIAAAAQRDAKVPSAPFSGTSIHKRELMTPEVLALADAHMGDAYRRLETLRIGGSA